MGRIRTGIRERAEYLRRLAVVFAVPIRLKIVAELYQREMSPKQFYEEFGGGSLSRVAQHFERLRKTGWLRLVWREGPGGRRLGGVENIYRATALAYVDRETWAILPYSIRAAFSWNTFVEIGAQFRGALEALTFQARPDRRLTGTRVLLDREGWLRVANAVTEEFAAQFEEQEDARRRAARTGEKLFSAGALLLAFELPLKEGARAGLDLAEGEDVMVPFPVRVSKVFEDVVCLQITDEANRHGRISVPMIYEKYGKGFGLSKSAISRRFRKLGKYGWLKQVEERTGGRRRGATERFYSATGPALYRDDENGPWAQVSDGLSQTEEWPTWSQLSEWFKAALLAGTITCHDETCLAWSILHVDQEGWERVIASLEKLHAFVLKEHEQAEARLERSGDEPIGMVIGLGLFETPEPAKEP